MVTVRVYSELKTSWKSVGFTNKVGKNSRYFVGVFNKTIIPLALVAIYRLISNVHSWNLNSKFASSPKPLFQSEAKCEAIFSRKVCT